MIGPSLFRSTRNSFSADVNKFWKKKVIILDLILGLIKGRWGAMAGRNRPGESRPFNQFDIETVEH
jgi:hypothetical protein